MPLGRFRQTGRAWVVESAAGLCWYDVNILGWSIHTKKKNTEALVVAGKKIDVDWNAEKIKYMVMSWDQNAERKSQHKDR